MKLQNFMAEATKFMEEEKIKVEGINQHILLKVIDVEELQNVEEDHN